MTNRAEVLSQITALMRQHDITLEDIAAAPPSDPAATHEKSTSVAMRVFSYLGGIFVFSGIGAYVAMFWSDMNSPMRVIITLGSGFTLFIIGVITAHSMPRSRAVAPLLLLAAILQPTGMFVAIKEYFNNGGDPRYAALLVFGVMLVQQGLTFKALKHAILLCTTLAFACLFLADIFDLMHVKWDLASCIIGFSLLAISYGLDKSPYRRITGIWYFIGGMSLLIGTFGLVEHTSLELFYLGLTCVLVYVSTIVQSTVLLVISVLAMLFYIGYFTEEHFVHSVGWPVALIILGLAFFAVGAGAIRIKKKYL